MYLSLINKEIEPFRVNAYHNGQFIEVSKDTLKDRWNVVFFYPADFTFVCPTELEDLADHYDKFKEIGCEIYSVSTDTHFVHKAWHDTSEKVNKVRFPMLADPTGKLARQFGVMKEEEGVALRGTFIVDPNGYIRAYEVHDLGIGRDCEETLRKVQAAQFVAAHGDMVCPARWKPGEKTLKPTLNLVGKL